MPTQEAPIQMAGVTLTNPTRVLFAEQGLTKQVLAAYYIRIADRMLPHIIDRPLSLVRCPQGQEGGCFFQKHWTGPVPEGLGVVDLDEESGDRAPYLVVRDVRGLIGLVQHGVLEFHVWGARASDITHPDRLVMDFDPGPDVSWEAVVHTARRARAVLHALGLRSWIKTTGGKGLHVVVPLAPTLSWEDLRDVARLLTAQLVRRDPDRLIDVATKAKRQGRIFVDYLRNGRGATAIAPWSSRARPGAPIAAPVSWRGVGELRGGDPVHVADVEAWLRHAPSDPWQALTQTEQTIDERVMERLLTATPRVASMHEPRTR